MRSKGIIISYRNLRFNIWGDVSSINSVEWKENGILIGEKRSKKVKEEGVYKCEGLGFVYKRKSRYIISFTILMF